jgi:hypothetical protein
MAELIDDWLLFCKRNYRLCITKTPLLPEKQLNQDVLNRWLELMLRYNADDENTKNSILEIYKNIKRISFDEFLTNFNYIVKNIISHYIMPKHIKKVYLYVHNDFDLNEMDNINTKSNFWCSIIATNIINSFNIRVIPIFTINEYSNILNNGSDIPILFADDCMYTGNQFRYYIEYDNLRDKKCTIYSCIPYVNEASYIDYINKNITNLIINYVNIIPDISKYMPDDTILTYFEHKFADCMSLNDNILLYGRIFDLKTKKILNEYEDEDLIGSLINTEFYTNNHLACLSHYRLIPYKISKSFYINYRGYDHIYINKNKKRIF